MKIRITIESREDGGLRVYSDDLPGLVLSHSDSERVIADISPALLEIMKYLSEHQPERLAKSEEKEDDPTPVVPTDRRVLATGSECPGSCRDDL